MNQRKALSFRFIAGMVLMAFCLAVPSLLAQVAGEKQAPGLPQNQTLPEKKMDLWKGAEAKFTPVPQTESAPAAKLDFSDLTDHLAFVFDFQGDVRILKENADRWAPVKKEMKIEIGDQIFTGKDSNIDIAYDKHFLNIARIGANTKAEFVNIEPTDIHMEDGAIFSALDGLKKGDSYQISTRTAVAGVRGTAFEVKEVAGNFEVSVIDERDPLRHGAFVTYFSPELTKYNFEVEEGKRVILHAEGAVEFQPISETVKQLAAEIEEKVDDKVKEEAVEAFNQSFEVLGKEAPAADEDDTEKAPAGNNDGNDGGGNLDNYLDAFLNPSNSFAGPTTGKIVPENTAQEGLKKQLVTTKASVTAEKATVQTSTPAPAKLAPAVKTQEKTETSTEDPALVESGEEILDDSALNASMEEGHEEVPENFEADFNAELNNDLEASAESDFVDGLETTDVSVETDVEMENTVAETEAAAVAESAAEPDIFSIVIDLVVGQGLTAEEAWNQLSVEQQGQLVAACDAQGGC